MTAEQLAKMQAGRRAASEARKTQVVDEHADWQARHDAAAVDAAERRKALWGHA